MPVKHFLGVFRPLEAAVVERGAEAKKSLSLAVTLRRSMRDRGPKRLRGTSGLSFFSLRAFALAAGSSERVASGVAVRVAASVPLFPFSFGASDLVSEGLIVSWGCVGGSATHTGASACLCSSASSLGRVYNNPSCMFTVVTSLRRAACQGAKSVEQLRKYTGAFVKARRSLVNSPTIHLEDSLPRRFQCVQLRHTRLTYRATTIPEVFSG